MVVKAKNGKYTEPVTYMWWAHTATERAPIDIVAKIKPL